MEGFVQEAFPSNSYSSGSLCRTIWYLFTRHSSFTNTVISVTLLVGVAQVLIQNGLIEIGSENQLSVYRAIWVIVLIVSLLCCYYYVKLVANFQFKLLYEQSQRYGAVLVLQLMVALFCLGLLSIYSLVQQIQLASSKSNSVKLNWFWKFVFTATAFVGILQRVLAAIFICIALPVAKRWACAMKPNTKLALLELLPWKIFLLLHRNLLSAFFEKSLSSLEIYEDSVYIVSIGFRCFCLLWLLYIGLYVGYDFAIPCKNDSQLRGRRELAGVPKKVLIYPPKSQVVTGLSSRRYALRYRGFPSNGEEERETKVRMRNNAVAHEQYRIVHSELC